jgi:transcriptional regulator with XRE-family HTH domain
MTLGLTQEQLAAQAGVAIAYLNQVENGRARPSQEFILKLSRVIGPIDDSK